jgi:hypothetical protein
MVQDRTSEADKVQRAIEIDCELLSTLDAAVATFRRKERDHVVRIGRKP